MKWITDPVLKTAGEVTDRAERLLANGKALFHAQIQNVPLLASARARGGAIDRHETHVFLIPHPDSERRYVLYKAERLPEGYASANDLPRVRIFHLPGPGGEQTLIHLLKLELLETLPGETDEGDLGELLQRAGTIIDEESGKVTGGLLLIGGAIALVNPLVGLGVAAKALIPSVGGKLSTEGLRFVGERLSKLTERRKAAKRDRQASKALRSVSNLSVVNPFLQALESGDADLGLLTRPVVERFPASGTGCEPFDLQTITAEALIETHRERPFPEVFDDWIEVVGQYTGNENPR